MNFDAGFVTRLQQRDPDACNQFVRSLGPALEARLRCNSRAHESIEDIRNETFYRVFHLVDRGRVREPQMLGSFVRGVCDRVAQETRRKLRPCEPLDAGSLEPSDAQPHPDELLVEKERSALLWAELARVPAADRKLILEMFSGQADRTAIAQELGLTVTGLNVRLCRALKRLRARVLARQQGVRPTRRACRPRLHIPLKA